MPTADRREPALSNAFVLAVLWRQAVLGRNERRPRTLLKTLCNTFHRAPLTLRAPGSSLSALDYSRETNGSHERLFRRWRNHKWGSEKLPIYERFLAPINTLALEMTHKLTFYLYRSSARTLSTRSIFPSNQPIRASSRSSNRGTYGLMSNSG